MAVTYDDFLKQAQASGLYGNFSSYDLDLAKSNPAAGLGILSAKQQYASATDEAGRLAANALANQYRSAGGSYTGGRYGTEYNPDLATMYPATGYEGYIQDLLGQSMNYGDFSYGSAPTYSSRWDDSLVKQHQAIQDYGPFNQDVRESALWQNYKQQAVREGDRAFQENLGSAAAMTGGQLSSTAMAAAAQARDYSMAQLNDQYTNVYNTLYSQYMNDFNMLLSKMESTMGLENMDYNKFLNELQQYNVDRDFAFNEWRTGFDMLQANLGNVTGLDQQQWERNYTARQTAFENEMAEKQFGLQLAQAQARSSGSGGGGYGGGGGESVLGNLFHEMFYSNSPSQYLAAHASELGLKTDGDRKRVLEEYNDWLSAEKDKRGENFNYQLLLSKVMADLNRGDTSAAWDKIVDSQYYLTAEERKKMTALVDKYRKPLAGH